jgi:hypothetical protein
VSGDLTVDKIEVLVAEESVDPDGMYHGRPHRPSPLSRVEISTT